MSTKIHLISGPRNLSTALMYSFENRIDTDAIDEPFYAYYLRKTNVDHPGKEVTLKAQSHDPSVVRKQLDVFTSPYLFIKNMAHHMVDLDWGFILPWKNILLIRHPRQLIASFAQVIENPTMQDIGLKLEVDILEYLIKQKTHPVVIDSGEILNDPESVLKQLCIALDIPFSERMLTWNAGSRKVDGVWAPYWYKNVHLSTGFYKQKSSTREFPTRLMPLLEEAIVCYDRLLNYTITA